MANYYTYSDKINVSNFVGTELETASFGSKHEAKSLSAFFFQIKKVTKIFEVLKFACTNICIMNFT
jgi:hypothetical protein